MSITIDLPYDVEINLRSQANARGLALPEYLQHLLKQQVIPGQDSLTPSERAVLWLEGSKRYPHTPNLSDEAISRESMYQDRG